MGNTHIYDFHFHCMPKHINSKSSSLQITTMQMVLEQKSRIRKRFPRIQKRSVECSECQDRPPVNLSEPEPESEGYLG